MRRLASAPVFAPRYRRAAYWWGASRLLLLLWTLNAVPYFSRGSVIGDVMLYHTWADTMTAGSYPHNDPQWQYPPAAALVMLAPKIISRIGMGYVNAFFIVALLADAFIYTMLIGQADRIANETGRKPHLSGVWAWVLGGFALGPIIYMRYDVIVTALAVGGMVWTVKATARRSAARAENATWTVRGVLLGLGAMVKVWPVVLLAGVPGGRRGVRTLASAIIGSVVICGLLAVSLPGSMSFLSHQSSRGIEVEAVFASPFMIASWFGYPIRTVHEDGNFQLAGPGTGIVASGAIITTLIGWGIVLWWRVRRFHPDRWTPGLMYDAGFTVLLVMVVTSRVLSPQYMIWLIGLAALCLAENGPGRRGTLMAVPARLVMCCTLVSQIEFPLLFNQILKHGFLGNAIVAGRNIVLLVATLLALRALWSATTADEPSEPDETPGSDASADPDATRGSEPAAQPEGGAEASPDLEVLEPAGASGTPASTGGQSTGVGGG